MKMTSVCNLKVATLSVPRTTLPMRSTPTFRMDHNPLRHKKRRMWGGALMPAVLVFLVHIHLVLSWVRGFDEHPVTGRRLLVKHLLFDATNDTVAAQHARSTTVFDDLSRRADELMVSTCVFAGISSLTSLCIACMLWRRVRQLQEMLQPESLVRVLS